MEHAKPGPPELGHGRKTGGVGVQTRIPIRAILISKGSKDYQDAYEPGRTASCSMDLAAVTVYIGVICGWIGAVKGSNACDRICVTARDMNGLLDGPKLLVGDVNGDLQGLESAMTPINQEGWLGLGAHGHLWGGKASEATCHTNPNAKETRRDDALDIASLLPSMEGVRVHAPGEFPTHERLQN